MKQHPLRAIATVLIILAGAACGTSTPRAAATPSPAAGTQAAGTPAAVSYEEFQDAFCSAFTSLIRAVGNPDAGTPSVNSKALDDAVAAGDAASAEGLAATITAELEAGRHQTAMAAGWQPGVKTMVALDRVLVAFEAEIAAKRAMAAHAPGASPQAAFEQAGGVEAWSALVQGTGTMAVPAGASPKPCPAFSGTP